MQKGTTIIIESAEQTNPDSAPQDCRPTYQDRVLVYDDELPELPPMMGWRPFFNGGSNRLH